MAREKLILCFDGTGNEPADSEADKRLFGILGTEDNSVSNICKLHLLFGGDLKSGQAIEGQQSFYYSGVGTYGGTLRRVFNTALAPDNKDVGRIVRAAVKDLAKWEQNNPDSEYELFIFGFSRGAAIARRFASVFHDFSEIKRSPKIRFIGVFDTVAAIGKPNLDDDTKPVSDVLFENGSLSLRVEEALHLLSLDERRVAFQPTLMNKDQRVTEVWFPGVHSDIGGGFRFDALSDVTLQFMLDEIKRRDLGLQVRDPINIPYKKINSQCDNCDLDLDDLIIQPNPLGKIHPKKRPPVATRITLADRTPRINVDDQPSTDENDLPLIHIAAIERVHEDRDYRPKSLRGSHKVLYTYGAPNLDHVVSWGSLGEHLMVGDRPAKPLEVDTTQATKVYANRKYNRSGVLLEKDATYLFSVPKGQVWYDASIACDEKGWDRDSQALGLKELFIKLSEGKRRLPDAKWFELIGAVDSIEDNLFRVIEYTEGGSTFSPKTEGELHFFANDLDRMYGNNRGFITVNVTRIA
ncbi:MAG: DUF2235 domain-containing protein [Gammaproteobacteria bacterium]|nr:DUF2235 domain-containing protein [Gammaproteobacteria bacterium]